MNITNFTQDHIPEAQSLALQNYEEERGFVPALPQIETMPDLTLFANNGMGISAFEDGKIIGFLCGTSPFPNAFQSTDAVGVFSPMHANGAVKENRAKIYALMYQAAAEKWVASGAASHAVCLYAHDKTAQEQFFRYGFGLRCLDAIRGMEPIACASCAEYDYAELPPDDYPSVFPLHTMLNRHQCASPFFMNREPSTPESFIRTAAQRSSRFFTAKFQGEICSYLRIEQEGETFVAEQSGYIHIGGAYCLPEHRGKGVYQNLLNDAISTLKAEGYTRLGVDFESINPTAYGFWLKHFTAYTHSVVRRIDESAIK